MADNTEEQPATLQDLFASLRASSNKSATPTSARVDNGASNQQSYTFNFVKGSDQNPYAEPSQPDPQSSSIPQSYNGYQQRTSGIPSPTSTPSKTLHSGLAEHSAVDRTANLLSLLKFNQSSSSQNTAMQNTPGTSGRPDQSSFQPSPGPSTQHTHGRGLSTSDLVANFMGRTSSSLSYETLTSSVGASKSLATPTTPSAANPQDYLLQLLNRPKTTASGTPTPAVRSQSQVQAPGLLGNQQTKSSASIPTQVVPETSRQNDPNLPITGKSRTESPLRTFGTSDIKETTPFEPENMPKAQPPSQTIFTYVNPFEQLAASSPRNAKSRSTTATPPKGPHKMRQEIHTEGIKRKNDGQSPARTSSSSRQKLTPTSDHPFDSIESPVPAHPGNGPSRLEALMGIGAPTNDPETVAEALNEVGAHVSRQVDNALAQGGNLEGEVKVKDEKVDYQQEVIQAAVEEGLQDAVTMVKEEYGKDENTTMLEEVKPEEVATAIKETIEEAADDGIGCVGSNADDTQNIDQTSGSLVIAVYNFPMKPFVSIDIKQDKSFPTQQLREDAIIDIARLKKDFDQIDRTLATASSNFILYAMPKSGGLRIIRQEDGSDRQMYRETNDRIFNVAISTAAPSSALRDVQTFVATGVSGTVYWATISQSGEDIIQETAKVKGLVFPPVPAYDEHTSGGQLKTRAKKSSRHPEFFAIGRGKSIQIVFPAHARDTGFPSWAPPDSTVDTNSYFKERCLKISTGKAGKDFTFSEDDTVITTLDKAGRLRFWDIRDLVDESNGTASKIAPIEIKTPVLSFSTTSSSEKSWPTSVLFVDKVRPYVKCTALRYLIVGMKQNHTLQLWDLGLGKAVQELNFPHQKESDAICSVCYHPGSGIIVVGHPTRNSIYFIHLSAPKYNLPAMSQARFVQRLASKDTTLPQPESTAIMSGVREYSFWSKGQLRSIDLLPVANDPTKSTLGEEDAPLFELYVMHSKGVTCLSIKKEDLGWSQDSKVLNPLDAEEHGLIEVRDLREPQSNVLSEKSSVNGDVLPTPASQTKGSVKQSPKFPSKTASVAKLAKDINETAPSESSTMADSITNGKPSNGPEKGEPRKKKRNAASSTVVPVAPTPSVSGLRSGPPGTQSANKSTKETKVPTPVETKTNDTPEVVTGNDEEQSRRNLVGVDPVPSGISGEVLDQELKKLEKIVSEEFQNVLSRELGTLYRRFDEDKRVQDAAGAAKQDAILRLVSSTLTDNVEKSLARIVNASVQQFVVPSISEVTGSALSESIPTVLGHQLLHTLPTQLKLALPEAVSVAIQSPDVLRVLSDQVTAKVATQVERQFSAVLQQTILPAFQNLAIGAAQKMNAETERRVAEQLQQFAVQRHEDILKIDQLTASTRALIETVHAMADTQTRFQQEILTLQQQALQERRESSAKALAKSSVDQALAPIGSPEPMLSPEQRELQDIIKAMQEGNYEQATIQVIFNNQVLALKLTFHSGSSPGSPI
jgi:hypothetical protein